MSKSQSQTDAEILASSKIADEVNPEGSSTIRVRNTSSVHPTQCNCLLHRNLNLKKFNPKKEADDKTALDWYQRT
jgi:hypothetical protein